MDIQDIERIEREAQAREAAEAAEQVQAEQPEGVAVFEMVETAEQFAEFLDIAAKVASVGLNAPTIPARFTHQANLDIAKAAVKLCEKYGFDARAVLIGEDSAIGAWLGLGVAVIMPGWAVYMDIKAAKAQELKEVKEAAKNDSQQSSQ